MSDISKIDSNFAIETKIDKEDIKFYKIDEAPFRFMEFSEKTESSDVCLKMLPKV